MDTKTFRLSPIGSNERNPSNFTQGANTFAQAAAKLGPVTLLINRNENTLEQFVVLSQKAADANVQMQLAKAVGARLDVAEIPESLGATPSIGLMQVVPNIAVGRDSQIGADPAESSRILATSLQPGSWAAITFRSPTKSERKAWLRWLAHRTGVSMPTHHSVSTYAVLAQVTVGAAEWFQVEAIVNQLSAALPGFDLDVRAVPPAGRAGFWKAAGVGALVAGGAFFGLPQLPPEALAELPGAVRPALTAAGLAVTVGGGLGGFGYLPTETSKLIRGLNAGELPVAGQHRGRIRPPRRESSQSMVKRDSQGNSRVVVKEITEFEGDYPLSSTGFMLGPNSFIGVISPHGDSTVQVSTETRNASPVFRQPVGPLIGADELGPVYLSADTLRFGCALFGRPGVGKSVMMRTLFGWHALERVAPSGRLGHPGKNNALIVFEPKDYASAAKYLEWSREFGDSLLTIDALDPTTPAIDLIPSTGTLAERVSFLVNSMRYAFGDDAIGDRSYETLTQVFTGALVVTDEMLAEAEGLDTRLIEPGLSPFMYAHILLGALGDSAGVELHQAILTRTVRLRERGTPDPDLESAVKALTPLYSGSPSNRLKYQEAPRSKVMQLNQLEVWNSPKRRHVTWDQIIAGHRAVVVNTGTSRNGTLIDDSINQQMSSMLMYGLRRAIQVNCANWVDAGRSVSIFADELGMLAGSSPEVIAWLRDQGRSYGVRAFMATQRPEQLGKELRNNLLTYATVISFSQTDRMTKDEIAWAMGSSWNGDDIDLIEKHHVAIHSELDQTRQPAFLVKLPYYEGDISGFPAAQGYQLEAPR